MGIVSGPLSWLLAGDATSAPPPVPGPGPTPAPGIRIARRVPTILWLNDTPIESLGLRLTRPSGALVQAATAPIAVTGYPGLTGGRYDTLQAVPARTVSLEGWHTGSDFGARALWLDTLSAALRGLLELRWADTPHRVMRGVAQVVVAESASPLAYVDPALRVSVTILCADTASYDRHAQLLPLSISPRAVPLGTLPSGGELGIDGPFSGALNVDLLAPTGVVLERLALKEISLAAGAALTVRLDPPHTLVRTNADGTQAAVAGWRDAALSTRWWQPSPSSRALAPRLVLVPAIPATPVTGWYRYHRSWA